MQPELHLLHYKHIQMVQRADIENDACAGHSQTRQTSKKSHQSRQAKCFYSQVVDIAWRYILTTSIYLVVRVGGGCYHIV